MDSAIRAFRRQRLIFEWLSHAAALVWGAVVLAVLVGGFGYF